MKKKKVFLLFYTFLALIFSANVVFADVGSFESYSSGSSGGGSSSWSSSSSGRSHSSSSYSSYDYDDDYSGGSMSAVEVIAFIAILIIVVAIQMAKSKQNMPSVPRNINTMPQYDVESKIKEVDELFNKEVFLSWAKNIFVKLQEAWMERDWSTIRTFETNELYEQHKRQLQGYIDAKQINMLERICVKSASLYDFKQEGGRDILSINLSSKMIDYIVDEDTKQIIKGDKITERHSTYRMTFVRKSGIKTKATTGEVKTTNCPNCGAPTEVTSSGKCSYCGSVITNDEHDWVLSNLEKVM